MTEALAPGKVSTRGQGFLRKGAVVMKMTQEDYEERAARVADGTADDDDRRLVEHYEREGYSHGTHGLPAGVTATGTAEVTPAPKKTMRRTRGSGNGEKGQTR